jgi:hypothetical protein
VSITNKNTMYIVVAVVVIIIVVVAIAGAYVLMNPGGGGGGGDGEETVYTMGNATSIQYDVNLTTAGVTGTYNFAGKNLGTTDTLLRVDANPVVSEGTVYSYIMYAANQTSYSNATGTWDVSVFATDWPTYSTQFEGYIDHNPDWKTGDSDITYTDNSGNTVVIFNIVLNPSLPDSLFQTM